MDDKVNIVYVEFGRVVYSDYLESILVDSANDIGLSSNVEDFRSRKIY
jgi:hypothetical protein